MDLQIKRLTPVDASVARDLAEFVAGNSVTVEHTADFLKHTGNVLLAALADGGPVGFLVGHILNRFKDLRRKFFIYEIDVLPAFQRKGIGRRLIECSIEVAAETGCDTAFVLTNHSNRAASRLYAATGGRAVHTDDILFEYDLGLSSGRILA